MKTNKACQIAVNILLSRVAEAHYQSAEIIAMTAEAVIKPHSWMSKLIIINQVGDSVATKSNSEEDAYY